MAASAELTFLQESDLDQIYTLPLHTASAEAAVTEIWRFEVWCFLSFFVKPGALALVFFSSFSFRIVSAIK